MGRIITALVFSIPKELHVLYKGTAITSKGIMNENRKIKKIACFPLNVNFAKVYPPIPFTKKPSVTVAIDTMREFFSGI
jgi:hypothetical protein